MPRFKGPTTFSMRGGSDLPGYYPQWTFRMPPGVGRAEQWAYSIYAVPPFINCPGDVPFKQLVHYQRPSWHPYSIFSFGIPVSHGDPKLTPLSPAVSGFTTPYQDVYPGGGVMSFGQPFMY